MPIIVWGALGILGIGVTGWAVSEAGEAADSATKLVKWGTAAGVVYVAYRAASSAGMLK